LDFEKVQEIITREAGSRMKGSMTTAKDRIEEAMEYVESKIQRAQRTLFNAKHPRARSQSATHKGMAFDNYNDLAQSTRLYFKARKKLESRHKASKET
jgi:hypothetical protein